jgi:hypothetical protein
VRLGVVEIFEVGDAVVCGEVEVVEDVLGGGGAEAAVERGGGAGADGEVEGIAGGVHDADEATSVAVWADGCGPFEVEAAGGEGGGGGVGPFGGGGEEALGAGEVGDGVAQDGEGKAVGQDGGIDGGRVWGHGVRLEGADGLAKEGVEVVGFAGGSGYGFGYGFGRRWWRWCEERAFGAVFDVVEGGIEVVVGGGGDLQGDEAGFEVGEEVSEAGVGLGVEEVVEERDEDGGASGVMGLLMGESHRGLLVGRSDGILASSRAPVEVQTVVQTKCSVWKTTHGSAGSAVCGGPHTCARDTPKKT